MNSAVGDPRIGQWYERTDNADVFQVTGIDEAAGTIEIQSFDGSVDEIDASVWAGLPLERSQPAEDWMAPMENMEAQDLASSQAETILENPLVLEQLADMGQGYRAQ